MSGASGGVAGVEPDSVDTDSDGVGITLGIGRPNSDYLEFIEESFWEFKIFKIFKLSLKITSMVKNIFESIEYISHTLFIPLSRFPMLRNSINLI